MIKRNKERQALLLLWGITLVSCIIIYFQFVFGNKFFVFKDVGSDTYQQYLMHYASISNAIQNGTLSLWDFTNGFGTSLYALNLFHPLLFLLYLAGAVLGAMRLPYLMVFFEIGQIFLAVSVFFFFLKEYSISLRSRVITAYIYGFSGYLIVWGQHYQFGLYTILLPLLLLLMERALKKRHFSFSLTLAVAFTVMGSVYMSYMTLLTVGLYLLLRLITLDYPTKERGILFLKNCASILLGIGMIAIVFIPSAFYLFSISTRLDSSGSLLSRFVEHLNPYGKHFYMTAFYRLFSTNLQGISTDFTGYVNYYEAPVLFLSVLFVILFLQYILTIHRQAQPQKVKIVQYLALLLSAFFLLTRAGSMIYNAFTYAFSRHSFAFMPFACLIIAVTLERIFIKKQLSYIALGISLLLFLILYLNNSGTSQASPLIICAIGIGMLLILLLICHPKKQFPKLLLTTLLLLLVMTSSIYDSYHSTNNREVLLKGDGPFFDHLYGRDITAALAYLHSIDDSFYRIEQTYEGATHCMDSLAQNRFGVSTYNSTPNKNIQEFVNTLWPGFVRMSDSQYSYTQAVHDAELASLLNIKYLLSYSPQLNVDGFILLEEFGNLYVYKNTNTDSIGKFFTKVSIASEIPTTKISKEQFDSDRLISEALILDEETIANYSYEQVSAADYTLEKSDYQLDDYPFSKTDSFSLDITRDKLPEHNRIYLDFDLTFDKYSVVSIRLNDSMVHYVAGNAGETTHLRLRLPSNSDYICITTTAAPISGTIENIAFYYSTAEIQRPQAAATMHFEAPKKHTLVTGTVSTDTNGLLLLAVPYEDGWYATIDGVKADIIRGDYGFITLDLEAGNHEIVLKYQPKGFLLGTGVSIVSVLIFAVLWGVRRYDWRKK